LWLGPTLLVVTIPAFYATSKLEDASATSAERLPLFFNEEPRGAAEHAVDAAKKVAAGDPNGKTELSRLGGAALPHVLPLLDTLPPDARAKVAVALSPIARRMGIAVSRDLDSPEEALLFWTQFWDEHGIDFRSSVIRRTVRRFAEHPSALRRAEVIELDTVALEDLIDEMRPIKTDEDVARVRQITEAAAHVTGLPWLVPEGATTRQARAVATRWQTYWLEHQADYVALAGARRLAATLLETRYGRWAAGVGHRELGSTRDGRSVGSLLKNRGATTLLLIAAAICAGYPIGALLAILLFAFRRTPAAASVSVLAVLLSACGTLGLAAFLMSDTGALSRARVTMIAGAAAAVAFQQRGLYLRLSERPHLRTILAFGGSPLRAVARTWKLAAPSLAASVVGDFPALVTAAFVAERAFSLHGLSEPTLEAIHSGDPAFLMALAFGSALVLGVAQIAVDLVHGLLDPRVRIGQKPNEEAT
jgi:ABC-type dipeptide/oligopeptide/nickel transport system permease component